MQQSIPLRGFPEMGRTVPPWSTIRSNAPQEWQTKNFDEIKLLGITIIFVFNISRTVIPGGNLFVSGEGG